MPIAKCDNSQDVCVGGHASLSGNTKFYAGRAEAYDDPMDLNPYKVLSGRFLAGEWRGEVLPQTSADHDAPAANTAAVITYDAVDYRRHVLFGLAWSYSAQPTGGNIKVEDGDGNILFSQDISSAGAEEILFPKGLKGPIGKSLVITLAAGSGTVEGELNVIGRRVE